MREEVTGSKSLRETRELVKQRIREAGRHDPRIVGVIDYGATSQGRGDVWSDLDVALFIRDADLEAFEADWRAWAAQLGPLLLAYVGGVGHPWAVYDAQPMPLRVDLAFRPASGLDDLAALPLAPVSVQAMVWYDATGGALSARVEGMVGQSLAPADLQAAFDQVCGDFWTYQLRTIVRLLRGEEWAARHDFNFVIVGNLLALLRLEAGAIDRWRGSNPSAGIEAVLSPRRRIQLEGCIPGPGTGEIQRAMHHAAVVGGEVCQAVAEQHGWSWPRRLAERVLALLLDPGLDVT